jgi:hypothetical protein
MFCSCRNKPNYVCYICVKSKTNIINKAVGNISDKNFSVGKQDKPLASKISCSKMLSNGSGYLIVCYKLGNHLKNCNICSVNIQQRIISSTKLEPDCSESLTSIAQAELNSLFRDITKQLVALRPFKSPGRIPLMRAS